MGFRFNKSIRIGKNFRINLSKSGIGYSYGVKGYRITKTAKGNIRHTISMPGTGISYIKEYNPNKKTDVPHIKKSNSNNAGDNNSKPPNKNIIKIILLCILSFLFLPLAPAIIATVFLKKSNIKKSKKTTFITLSWILNFFLLGSIPTTTPEPNETTPVVSSNDYNSTTNTKTITENNVESSTNTTSIETSSITSENTTNESTKETLTTQQTTVIETTTYTVTTEKPTETTTYTTTTEKPTETTTYTTTTEKPTETTTQKNVINYTEQTPYVGNRNNFLLHYSDCRAAKKLLPEHRKPFETKEEAISAGYTDLCGICFK